MDKKVNQMIRDDTDKFREQLKTQLVDLGLIAVGNQNHHHDATFVQASETILNFINNYEFVVIQKEDLKKRRRVKNIVPMHERCCALRSDGGQCTRRSKDGNDFCGTHIKGIPHGQVNSKDTGIKTEKISVRTQDIQGIIYWIDDNNNIYNSEDIMKNQNNPEIIGKYLFTGDQYSIERFF